MTLNDQLRQKYLHIFCIVIFGCITMPMLPIWQGILRFLAILIVLEISKDKFDSWLIKTLTIVPMLMFCLLWLFALSKDPVGHIKKSLTDVYGQPLGVIQDLFLLYVDFVLVTSLLRLKFYLNKSLVRKILVVLPGLFWITSLSGLYQSIHASPKVASIIITALSGWATWIYFSALPLVLVKDKENINSIINSFVRGGLIVAVIVTLQWILKDFSYVLDSEDFDKYFFRVRGNEHYHASVTYTLAFIMPLILYFQKIRSPFLTCLALCLMVLSIYINSTRGISVSILVSSLFLTLMCLKKKLWVSSSVAFLVGCLFATSIFYIKPTSAVLRKNVTNHQLESILGYSHRSHKSASKIKELIRSNESRSLLLESGLDSLPTLPLWGAGAGNLKIYLGGDSFNGIRSTYSTHVLPLDIFLMCGLVGFSIFIIYLLGCVFISLKDSITDFAHFFHLKISLCSTLIIFLVGSLFFPQERNELIGIAFCLSTIALLPIQYFKENSHKSYIPPLWLRIFSPFIFTGIFTWTIFNSASYFLPVIEFSLRYGDEVQEKNSHIKTNEPSIINTLSFLLRLRGVSQPKISVLKDGGLEDLAVENTWILWSPANDHKYPEYRKKLSYQQFRPGGHSPSISVGAEWWVKPSFQPTFSFIYVGMRHELYVEAKELGKITQSIRNGWNQFKITKRFMGSIQFEEFQNPESNKPIKISMLSKENDHILYKENVSPKLRIATLSNAAPFLELACSSNVSGFNRAFGGFDFGPRALSDFDYGSYISWPAQEEAIFLFDLGENRRNPMIAYRIFPTAVREIRKNKIFDWKLYGSDNGVSWLILDERQNIRLSLGTSQQNAFFVDNNHSFRFYRFNFSGSQKLMGTFRGLSELEIFQAK